MMHRSGRELFKVLN